METKRIVIMLLPVLININTSEAAVCFDNKTAVYECCHDYKNNSGNCEACIGSFGKDCGSNCSKDYYGHGCRKRCSCSNQQICDPKEGCVEVTYQSTDSAGCNNNKTLENCQNHRDVLTNVKASSYSYVNQTVASLLAVSCTLILLLLGTVVYCNRKLKKESGRFQRCTEHEVNTSEIQEGQEDLIYNDIRESHLIDYCDTLSSVHNFMPQFCGLTSPMNMDKVTNHQPNKAKAPLTRSRTVGLEDYGHWYRGTDNYDHINFTCTKQLSSYSDVITSDYDIFTSPSTSHETQVNDDECGNKQLKEHPKIDIEASFIKKEN